VKPTATFVRAYPPAAVGTPAPGESIGIDEYREVAFVITRSGAVPLSALDGKRALPPVTTPTLGSATITDVSSAGKGRYFLGTSDGRAIPLDVKFEVTFPNGERTETPKPEFATPSSLHPHRKRSMVRLSSASTDPGPPTIALRGPA